MSRLLALGQNLLLLALSVLISLLGSELFVRLVYPQRLVSEPRHLYQVSPTLGYRLTSNYDGILGTVEFSTRIQTNSLGLRDHEFPRKTPGAFRILALGDSFTFGVAVPLENTYLKLLERRLRETSSEGFQVVNAGVDGYGPQHYLQYLNEAGLALEPDLVTIGFYVANDVMDRITYNWYIHDGLLFSRKPTFSFRYSLLHPINEFLEQRSHLFVFFRTRFDYALWKIGLRPYYFPDVFAATYAPRTFDNWEFTKRTLRDLARLAASRNIRLLLIVIPAHYQVHEEIWNHYLRVYDLRPENVDLLKPQRLLKQICEELNIPVLDLLPRFREVGTRTQLYFRIDGHWNPDGHRLAAEELHKFLVAQHLVPLRRPALFAQEPAPDRPIPNR